MSGDHALDVRPGRALLLAFVAAFGAALGCSAREFDWYRFLEQSWDSYLASIDEPGLCEVREYGEEEQYRLIHAPPFELPSVVRFEVSSGRGAVVIGKRGRSVTVAGETRLEPDHFELLELSSAETGDVLRQLSNIDFWDAASKAVSVEDGTIVLLEGLRGGQCHYLVWVSPTEDQVNALINTLLGLGRLKDADRLSRFSESSTTR